MTEVKNVPLPMPPSVDPSGGAAVVVSVVEDEEYDRLLTDLWVGIVLTLMVLSCVGCLFSCFLYHAFRQWQARVLEARRREAHMEAGYDTESLPSYTLVAGLPSYEEAIEQLKQGTTQLNEASPSNTDEPPPPVFSRLSVGDLLQIYKAGVKK